MSKMISGSINFDKLLEALKAGHSSLVKGKDSGTRYVNLIIWQNDEPDEHGQDFAITLNSTKEARESGKEKKAIYIGNAKFVKPKGGANEETVNGASVEDISDDLPF